MNRRSFTALIGTLSLSSLAGCSSDNNETDSPTDNPTDTRPDQGPTQTPGDSPSGTRTPGNGGRTDTTETDSPEPSPTAPDVATSTADQTTADSTPTQDPSDPTATPSPTPAGDYIIEVGPNGNSRYSPDSLTIEVGDTVTWIWRSDNHNIKTSTTSSDWEGTPGAEDTLYDEGYVYSHTFETPGDYEYYCAYHLMTASLTVE